MAEKQPSARERLKVIAETIRTGRRPPRVAVVTFLRWFGYERRGYYIVQEIRRALKAAGLLTYPDFESAGYYDEITFQSHDPAEGEPSREKEPTALIAGIDAVPRADGPHPLPPAYIDPTHRVGKLDAANQTPTGVAPDSTLIESLTLMLAKDFSQLPVMSSERDLKGVVSWASIGSRLALGQDPKTAREAMDAATEISVDSPLFDAIPQIILHGYALVRGKDNRVTGIVTTADLSLQFRKLAEPFLLLGEIENHIRRIIGQRFSIAELKSARDPADKTREVESVADLNFGEYQRLLEDPQRWSRLKLKIDRVRFTTMLDEVREIRNDVMHFGPDGIPNEDLEILRGFARFLLKLKTVGAT